MAITIPIITEFAGAGINKAVAQFKQLETAGEKASFAIKKAAVPAAAALVAVGAAAFDAVKGAMEDAAAQEQLARNIRGVTNASDSAIKKNEDFISSLSMATATADDELRPALAKLVIGTEDLEKAQKGLKLAQDIAAGTGKDLATVSDALSKAYAGNDKGLKALDPRMKSLLKAGIDVEGAMSILADTFGGDAAAAADTASGRFKQFQIGLEETKESIGAALLPAVEALLPFITQLGKWASDHTTVFIAVGTAITTIAVAVIAVNTASKLWAATAVATTAINAALATSFTALQVATGAIIITAIIAAVVALQVKFNILGKAIDGVAAIATALWDGMKTGFKAVVDVIKGYIDTLVGFYKGLFNGIADIWNNTVGKLSFKIPGWVPGIGGKGFDVPEIPKLADGGIITSPTIAMIGERGPEAVIPLSGRNAGGMGSINVTVNAGLVSTPDQIGQDIIQAIQKAQRRSGQVFANAKGVAA